MLWYHLEDHPELAGAGPLVCPRKECKRLVLESPGRFKAHAAHCHGSSFRVRIKLVTAERVKSPVGSAVAFPKPITFMVLENQALPSGLGPAYKSHICHGYHRGRSSSGASSALLFKDYFSG